MKIASIVGARPQFIKCAPVSREIRKYHKEILIHTGQHYDPEMSEIFFRELGIPKPDYYLGVGSGSHGQQTGEILKRTEGILLDERPDLVVVYGDTNSTLGGSLAAVKIPIPVAHIEAGLRSFDRSMPEEINRIMTDHISDLLFCPTITAVNNLAREGIRNSVYLVGDVMVDALRHNMRISQKRSRILETLGLRKGGYFVATVHRPSNTDNKKNLSAIIDAFRDSERTVVFPLHPRTRNRLRDYGLLNTLPKNVLVLEPLGYLDMLQLMGNARKILTDSGGIQKESFILRIPCITLRENTEWIETLHSGMNILVGADKEKILSAMLADTRIDTGNTLFGNGDASEKIMKVITDMEIKPSY